MPNLSPSLFIKEPGRTKNLIVVSPTLKKGVKSLKPGDLLGIESNGGKVILCSKLTKETIAELDDERIVKKVTFTLANKGEIIAIFVNLVRGLKAPAIAAQFLIKSSLPVFPEDVSGNTLRPFARSGEIPQEEGANEQSQIPESVDTNDDSIPHEDTDPLAGLTVINKEELAQEPEDL
jgi:hypothetical protein